MGSRHSGEDVGEIPRSANTSNRGFGLIIGLTIAISFLVFIVSVYPIGGETDIHQNSTWCWIVSDTDPDPGRICTSDERDALKEDDAATINLNTLTGDPIHFNSSHNESSLADFVVLDDVEICIEFVTYSIDSPTCLFRFMEENSTGIM